MVAAEHLSAPIRRGLDQAALHRDFDAAFCDSFGIIS
jgi:hypothetical protein